MAAIPVTIIGVLTDKEGSQNVTLAGMASLTGLEVGGGPGDYYPAHPIAPGGKPPSIWPSPGHPAHPIAPGGPPPSIWPSPGHPAHPIVIPPEIWPDPPEGQAPHPEHPIVIPIPPPEGVEGPPLEVKVVWTEPTGWVVVLVPTGEHVAPS